METTLFNALTLIAVATPSTDVKTCSSVAEKPEKTILETASANGHFQTLAAALKAAGLVDALSAEGPFTVFAPTDEAFAKLPKGTVENLLKSENLGTLRTILTYHVVSGDVRAAKVVELSQASSLNGQRIPILVEEGTVRVAGVAVVKTDIACSNGVIHVVDAVMMPATKDLISTAVGAGKFNTLATALKAAGLVDALSGPGPFTVFAPTDEAFAKLPKGTLENLLKPENREKLISILKHHVVSGRVYADQIKTGSVATLLGKPLSLEVLEKGVRVGGASVAQADIETTNGVIHVIDSVILP